MNLVEIGLSFVEGLALIASPCILPVLPLVLSASIAGGRGRPFGIILGFIVAFTAFALLSRELVLALGIDLDLIKQGSLILLALFGLVLISEGLSARFAAWSQRFAGAGSSLSAAGGEGFISGVLIGLLIGLVWTPCAGPILAAVLVQVIRQESDFQALALLGTFALGAGLPMLLIALGGRGLMKHMSLFTRHAGAVRKGFGVLMLLAVALLASGIDPQSFFARKEAAVTSSAGLQGALAEPYPAPEFAPMENWLNSPPLTMASLRGKVVLVDFWTYSCINCVRTLPYVTRWYRDYRDKGLVVVGLHAPEFEFEKDRANVVAAIARHGIEYPVAMDNRLDSWTNFKNRYWPAHYLIDPQGQVVYTHFGEGNYDRTENNIRHLLGLDMSVQHNAPPPYTNGQTPETYLGYERASHFASPEGMRRGELARYSLPAELALNHWALSGQWAVQGERVISGEKDALLRLHFTAGKVFLVLGVQEGPITLTLRLNDQPLGEMTVDQHTLYELVRQESMREGTLDIIASGPGLSAYAFTFGN